MLMNMHIWIELDWRFPRKVISDKVIFTFNVLDLKKLLCKPIWPSE